MDDKHRNGVYSENFEAYFAAVNQAAEEIGVRLVQAHSPLGTPLIDPDGSFLADTIRCVDACGAWGIDNLVVHSGYARGLDVDPAVYTVEDLERQLLRLRGEGTVC